MLRWQYAVLIAEIVDMTQISRYVKQHTKSEIDMLQNWQWSTSNFNISLTLSQCTLAGPVYTGMPLVDLVYTGIPLGDPANTCRVQWNTTGKT